MPDRRNVACVFDGSFDGFLNIIHARYYEKLVADFIAEEDSLQERLHTEYVRIPTDYEKAKRVYAAIQQKISEEAAHNAYHAFLGKEENRFLDLYRYILLGFQLGPRVDFYNHVDYVLHIHKLARYVGREAHLTVEFLRFAETENGVYYADISPENNVLAIVAEAIQARCIGRAWVIHDVGRGLAAIYDGNTCIFGEVPRQIQVSYSRQEENWQELWRAFYDTVANPQRLNYACQRNHLPLHYREHMTEHKRRR